MVAHGILSAVIFVEAGVVVAPFLPGDSLLFVAGALAAQGILQWPVAVPLLIAAAIAGDALNFAIGDVFRKSGRRAPLLFVKAAHIARTQAISSTGTARRPSCWRASCRSCAHWRRSWRAGRYAVHGLLQFHVIGAVAWVAGLIGAGYAFGNIAWVAANLTAVLLGIVAISLLPGIVAWLVDRLRTKAA